MAHDYEELRAERLAQIGEDYRRQLEEWPDRCALGVAGLRAGMAELSAAPPADGVTVRDLRIPGPAGHVPTRVYTPEGVEGPLGVTVHLHFGGFVAGGGLDFLDGANSRMALEAGCAVVAPDFRLPPEHPFPAGLEDCWAVVRWVAGHAAEQGWDAGRVAVGGGCSGGNLAAVIALMARDAEGPELSLQFLQSFVADARCDTASQREFADGYGLRHSDNRFVLSQYLVDEEQRYDWRVSPVLAPSVRGVAPALVTVGEWDILRDEDVQYAQRLRDAGVAVTLRIAPREGHLPNPDNAPESLDLLHRTLRETVGPHR
jgi:acetyl esterase